MVDTHSVPLVDFGNFLFSKEREENYREIEALLQEKGFNIEPTEERMKKVSDADLANWFEKVLNQKTEENEKRVV